MIQETLKTQNVLSRSSPIPDNTLQTIFFETSEEIIQATDKAKNGIIMSFFKNRNKSLVQN